MALQDTFAQAGQAIANVFLQDEMCDILTETKVRDQGLGKTTTLTVQQAGVPCKFEVVRPGSGTEKLLGDRQTTALLFEVLLPLGTVISTTNTLRRNGNRLYNVVGVLDGTFQALTTAYAVEIA